MDFKLTISTVVIFLFNHLDRLFSNVFLTINYCWWPSVQQCNGIYCFKSISFSKFKIDFQKWFCAGGRGSVERHWMRRWNATTNTTSSSCHELKIWNCGDRRSKHYLTVLWSHFTKERGMTEIFQLKPPLGSSSLARWRVRLRLN